MIIPIPYKCRCEALGGNKRRGGRYKLVNKGYFTLPSSWKNMKIFSVTDKLKILENISFDGCNYANSNMILVARPSRFIESAKCDVIDGKLYVNVFPYNGIMPSPLGIEVYDENLKLCAKKLTETKETIIDIPKSSRYKVLVVTNDESLCFEIGNWEKITSTENISLSEDISYDFADSKLGLIKITNNTNNDVSGKLIYEVYDQEYVLSSGEQIIDSIPARMSRVVKIKYDLPELSYFENFVKFSFVNSQDNIKTNYLKLPVTQSEPEKFLSSDMPKLNFKEDEINLYFTGTDGEDFSYVFDKKIGEFVKINIDNTDLIVTIPDIKSPDNISVRIFEEKEKYVSFMVTKDNECFVYAVSGDGEIGICAVNTEIEKIYYIDENFNRVNLFGNNEIPNIYDLPIDKPQNIDDTRFAICYNNQGYGLLIKGNSIFDFCFEKGKIVIKGKDSLSFFVRPTNIHEEDIIREARTLPRMG